MTGHPFTVTLKDVSVTVRCHALAAHGGIVVAATLSGDANALEQVWDLMRDGGLVSCNGQTYAGADLVVLARRQILHYRTAVLFLRDKSPLYLWGALLPPESTELYIALLRHFTTPILPEWMPWLTETLSLNGHLPEIGIFGTFAYRLNITQARLDDLVSTGVRSGRITIPQEHNV